MPDKAQRNRFIGPLAVWLLVFLAAWAAWNFFAGKRGSRATIDYSDFTTQLQAGNVESVTLVERDLSGSLKQEAEVVTPRGTVKYREFKTYMPDDPQLVAQLREANVKIVARAPSQWTTILLSLLPWVLILVVWLLFMRRMSSGQDRAFTFGKSRAKPMASDRPKVTFSDVAGVPEAKEELKEIIAFLKAPHKFQKLGGRIPKGVLLVGPTGTGKTLLAKAVAGEAGVPFLSISGSDFVEMFVGVGAARVRDLFEQSKRNAPCIVFIDEIDAVGRQRGAGMGGGHDEREQTLNQLLVEMDGFQGTEGVIVIAATNRPDVLDPALLRPGRFDRQVVVGLPDVAGREQILRVHMRKVPIGVDVDPRVIARGTPGFSGADLANLVNEAALLAARAGERDVTMAMVEKAKDKIMMGAERRSLVMSAEEKRLTAYHEAGHAIVGRLVPEHDPVHKVSIIPRGRALGVTLFLPERDRYSMTKRHIESQLSSLFGGRVAEEIVFGPDSVTTGAQNDIQRATELARHMVMKWGLSERLGPLEYQEDEGEVFLGRAVTQRKQVSDDTARLIDHEVRAIIDRNYERAREILTSNLDKLHAMAQALIQYETIGSEQIDDVMAGRAVRAAEEGGQVPPTSAGSQRPRERGTGAGPVVGRPVGQH